MALALLDFVRFDQQQAVFTIDIGTNLLYKFRVGNEKERRGGVEVIKQVMHTTRLQQKRERGTDLLDTSEEVRLPQQLFNRTNRLVQLVSCKDASGRSPAISRVVTVPVGLGAGRTELDINASIALMPEQRFNPNRRLSQRHPFLARELSVEDLLSSLIRTVLPAVVYGLGGATGAPASGGGTSAAGGAATAPATLNAVSSLLTTLLQAVTGRAPAVSAQQSYASQDYGLNRFTDPQQSQFSRPFIFGIDDALLAGLAGPLIQQGVQLLPQLINSANQHKLETLRANNQLMTGLNADLQRRLMLQDLLANMPPQAASGGAAMDAAQLMQLLQQLQAAGATTPAPAAIPAPAAPAAAPAARPATATASSFSYQPLARSLSSRVLLHFENAQPQRWNGTDKLIYQKGKPVTLNIKIIADPAPKAPLPKAIIRLVFKDPSNQQVLFEKLIRQKNILAGSTLSLSIGAEELAQLPVGKPLSLFAEMRWRSAQGKEYKAVGSEDMLFAENYFVKEMGSMVGEEKELTDLNTYRSFWNKVWESGGVHPGGRKKLWELNASLRYSVFLSPDHESNGLAETKLLQTPDDADSITQKTVGKMKSGIELSMAELVKLLPLWPGETALEPAKLHAISTEGFARNAAAEMIAELKMKGRGGVRGLVWVIPTFRLREIVLCKISQTDDAGLVSACSEEKLRFPVPVGVRILGLKSKHQI